MVLDAAGHHEFWTGRGGNQPVCSRPTSSTCGAFVNDLQFHFPFLRKIGHPYRHFYYLWKLSYLFGMKYRDVAGLLRGPSNPARWNGRRVVRVADIQPPTTETLETIVKTPKLGKWRDYAEESWFREHEQACEMTLNEFLVNSTEQ